MGAKIKQLLAQGKLVKLFPLGPLCSAKVAELVGHVGGFDAVWFDQEHSGLSIQQLEEAARGARSVGLDSFVRLTATDYATVMRPLEAGVGGVMAAQVRRVAEAAKIVEWARFHPQGMRGICGIGTDARHGTLPLAEYFRRAHEETLVLIQIEHIAAVEEVEKIAALAGVDGLFIGPADLSQSLGLPCQFDHPQVWQCIERTAAAARASKIHWGIQPFSTAAARRCLELGCRLLSFGFDVLALQRGLKSYLAEYGEVLTAVS